MALRKLLTTYLLVVTLMLSIMPLQLFSQVVDADLGAELSSGDLERLNSEFTTDEINKIRPELASLQDAVAGKITNHPLDTYSLLDQELFPIDNQDLLKNVIEKKTMGVLAGELSETAGDILPEEEEVKKEIVNLKNLNLTIHEDGVDLNSQSKKLYTFKGEIKDAYISDDYLIIINNSLKEINEERQLISIIDLRYFQTAIGHYPLPVFKIPVATDKRRALKSISKSLKKLELIDEAGTKIFSMSYSQVAEFLDFQKSVFNLSVSLATPSTYEKTAGLVAELGDNFVEASTHAMRANANRSKISDEQFNAFELFNKSVQSDVKNTARSQGPKEDKELLPGAEKKFNSEIKDLGYNPAKDYDDEELAAEMTKSAKEKAEGYLKKISKQDAANVVMEDLGENMIAGKKLGNRIHLLMARLSLPHPEGGATLRDGMVNLMFAFTEKDPALKKRFISNGLGHLIHSRFIKVSKTIAKWALLVGTASGFFFPHEMATFLYNTLSIPSVATEFIFSRPSAYGSWAVQTAKDVFVGWNPAILKQAYLEPKTFTRLMTGMAYMLSIIYATIGMPHIIVNTTKLVSDMKVRMANSNEKVTGILATAKQLKNEFIARENEAEKAYRDLMVSSMRKKMERVLGEGATLTDAEMDHIALTRAMENSRGSPIKWVADFGKGIFHAVTRNRFAQKSSNEIDTLKKALTHFLFSYCSFTNSGIAYSKIWNSYFFLRSFAFNPILLTKFTMYPQLFRMTATRGVAPTKLNAAALNRIDIFRLKQFEKMMDTEALAVLKKSESVLLANEAAIAQEVLAQTYKAMGKFIKNSNDLKLLTSHGYDIKNLGDKSVDKLSHESQTFFHVYYDKLLNRALERHLELQGFTVEAFDANDLTSIKEVKRQISTKELRPLIDGKNNQAKELVKTLAGDLTIAREAADESHKRWFQALKNMKMLSSHELVKKLSAANNTQVRRILSVERMIKDPAAMMRAVRAMIASNLVDKPQELAFLFLCMAGAQLSTASGADFMRPVQDVFMGPNSIFFLSRELFGVGFIYGVISGVLADTWMKLQMDEMNEKRFGRQIPKAFREKSFMNFFMHVLKSPTNSIWRNQKHYMGIITANLKAAFVNGAIISMIFRGRLVDLDSYIVGYMFSYLTPLSGWSQMLEQTYEMAADWYGRHFTRREKALAAVQEHIGEHAGRGRIIYNIFYKTYENTFGYFMGMFQSGASEKIGSRAFARITFGDYSVAELFAKGMMALKATPIVSNLPFAKEGCNSVMHLFLNNVSGWKHVDPTKLYK